ncbi:hypothetical protein SAMN05421770_1066 [Granulicella rosea]|uniref:Uncharacterized protein n=1 Tax=Granulicella rosea TaxID=474952 RepID=A0A239L198_9BACT|nr:hypothetical protein [Granulicella rosea]SNT23762.1 hypothetical protein SAMN05421770_1066 [Granulicella rosea]
MRRFITLAVLLFFTIPFGVSISGCAKKTVTTYCNGSDSGVVVGQATTLTLQPRLTGISLNEGAIGQVSSPSATDCKGNSVSISNYKYGSSDSTLTLLDVNPTTGALCGGTWNKNSGAGVADYTTCNITGKVGTAYVTASADGVTSNPIAVYVHPIVTSIVLGAPSSNCVTDPASNCVLDATTSNGCSTAAVPTNPTPAFYLGNACVSQGNQSQLAARVYQGTDPTIASNNISCLVGPLTFSPQTSTIATVTQAGVATALQPGTTIINANTSQSSSSAGLYSVCPPASISLAIAGTTTTSASINQNTTENLQATVVDTLGAPLTNLTLEYVSTTPTTIAGAVAITPTFPGSASITAICQPPSCNTSPFNQISLFGTGKTVTSNSVKITSPGTNSTVLYIASTGSQYIVPVDFTTNLLGSPVRLPYAPNSMVISQDLSTIYMGTTTELMVFNASTSTLASENNTVPGKVLSVSPDSSTVVIADPVHNLTYLYGSSGSVSTEIGGVGTRAQWTPDSNTVYITTSTGQLLVHSAFLGWRTFTDSSVDVAVTVPSQGAYFAGSTTTARTNCPLYTTVTGANGQQTTTNTFYPQASTTPVVTDRIAATNDGKHILGASATTGNFNDLVVTVPSSGLPANSCPLNLLTNQTFTTAPNNPVALGATATSITGVLATSDSAFGFVTYTGAGAVVPQYTLATSTLTDVPLATTTGSAAPIAPVAGVLAADDQTLYLGTTGDNLVHLLTRGAAGFTDSKTINPLLTPLTGTGYATPNLLVQRPRKSTN